MINALYLFNSPILFPANVYDTENFNKIIKEISSKNRLPEVESLEALLILR